MSAKKKHAVVECQHCSCYLHTKDLDAHQKECPKKSNLEILLASSVNIIVPSVGAIATNQNIENAASFLPPDLIGWEKANTFLMHPETMSRLRILPRGPCLLADFGNSADPCTSNARCVTVWPCDQVKEMQIFVRKARNGARYRVNVVNGDSIEKVSTVQLLPSSSGMPFLPLYAKKHFRNYMKAYLSNSYMAIGIPLCMTYYGQQHCFDIAVSNEEKLKRLNISSDFSLPTLLKPAPDCSYHIIDSAAPSGSSSRLTFADFGGAKNVKEEIEKQLVNPIKHGKQARSVILSGDTGCGKTLFLRIIQECLQSKALQLSVEEFEEFLENGAPNNEEKMAILVDDFDSLTHCCEKLCRFMDKNRNFVFLLAVRNIDAIELPLRRRCRCELQLPVPSVSDRTEILRLLFTARNHQGSMADDFIEEIALKTHGYTGDDLKAVVEELYDFTGNVEVDVDRALRKIPPTGIRQFVLEIPDVSWEDIGGYRELKLKIEQAVQWPYQYPELFKRFAKRPPSGILLYGPPGCSKTLIARAIASQSRMNFLSVKGPELFSKWVGESERAIRELFRRARQVAPAIIFFDEIDSMGAHRSDRSESHVGERVLTQLLTEIDGLEKKGDVLVLAATNRPDRLDSALLRPGRLGLKIYVPLPDQEARREILRIQLRDMEVIQNVDVEDISGRTEGFSGAEVVELCEQATTIAMSENKDSDELRLDSHHFHEALKDVLPGTDSNLLDIYEKFKRKGKLMER